MPHSQRKTQHHNSYWAIHFPEQTHQTWASFMQHSSHFPADKLPHPPLTLKISNKCSQSVVMVTGIMTDKSWADFRGSLPTGPLSPPSFPLHSTPLRPSSFTPPILLRNQCLICKSIGTLLGAWLPMQFCDCFVFALFWFDKATAHIWFLTEN